MAFKNLCVPMLWTNVAFALEGLRTIVPLGLFIKRTEFLSGSEFLSRYNITVGGNVQTKYYLSLPQQRDTRRQGFPL